MFVTRRRAVEQLSAGACLLNLHFYDNRDDQVVYKLRPNESTRTSWTTLDTLRLFIGYSFASF